MKKKTKKLVLAKETVLNLGTRDLRQIKGGMCDTDVVPAWTAQADACGSFECNTAPC
jgi:hypothetical protein